jgi:hypothetical protein
LISFFALDGKPGEDAVLAVAGEEALFREALSKGWLAMVGTTN